MKIYQCKLCPFTSENPRAMAPHYRKHHKGWRVKTETKVKPPELVTPDQIADALLKKVISWATEKETYVEQLKGMKELKNKAARLEGENKSLKDERDRLLKIHNEQTRRSSFTSTEDLVKLARGEK